MALAPHLVTPVAGLGPGELGQVQALGWRRGGAGVQAAREEHVVDQGVELVDVGVHLGQQAGAVLGGGGLGQLGGHPDPGQRGAQLVAGAGEDPALPLEQGLDPVGAGVEGPGQVGHLVGALHRHPGVQLALAEGLDGVPQATETAGGHSCDGPGGQGQQAEHHQQHRREVAEDHGGGRVAVADHEPATVGELDRQARSGATAHPVVAATAGRRQRAGSAVGQGGGLVGGIQGQRDPVVAGPLDHQVPGARSVSGEVPRQPEGEGPDRRLHRLTVRRQEARREDAADQADEHGGDQGQPDLGDEVPHQPVAGCA